MSRWDVMGLVETHVWLESHTATSHSTGKLRACYPLITGSEKKYRKVYGYLGTSPNTGLVPEGHAG